jgi:hypothetical protein
MFGENAPRTVNTHAAAVAAMVTVRRPRRSAAASRIIERTTPTRVSARTAPCTPVDLSNSSLANVIVWVITVPR